MKKKCDGLNSPKKNNKREPQNDGSPQLLIINHN